MTLIEQAKHALVARLLADELLAVSKLMAGEVGQQMRAVGSDRVTVADPDLTQLGKLTQNPDRMVWAVTDPAAFMAWVEQHRPDMIVRTVNPAFVKWVTDEAAKASGVVGDPETGQQIPGLGQEKRFGSFTVTKTSEARRRAAALVDRLMRDGLPAALPPATKE